MTTEGVPHARRLVFQLHVDDGAACLVHDFFRISGSKLALIGEK